MTLILPTTKVSIVGNGQVGKSTIRTMLEGESGPTKPTIGIDVGKYFDNELRCSIFDLGGQERFKMLWDDFIKGSNLIMVVTDSTREDVEKTKEIVHRLKKSHGSRIIAIANKQDQANRLNATQVSKILNVKTYPMIAIESGRKKAMVNIIKENLV
ncbi:MAG: ADP-ribosylation factor-like protein [Promethearchaeota archaeon]